jgi:uncharacterized membrane protein YcaP (DUF421 family)
MESLRNLAETLLGWSARPQELTYYQIGLRAVVVYLAMIAFVRFGKKRFLSRATAFDAILVIIIGSTAARAITGNAPFFGTLLGVWVLIALHWVILLATRGSAALGSLVKGTSTVLIRNGRVDRKALRAAHMSDEDLEEDLREEGVDDAGTVKEARLERSGKLSVIRK